MSKRERLLNDDKKKFKTAILDIPLSDGSVERVGIRTPSLLQAEAFSAAIEKSERSRLAAQMVIQCSFDPETGGPLFAPEDEDALREGPAQESFVEPIIAGIGELIAEARAAPKG